MGEGVRIRFPFAFIFGCVLLLLSCGTGVASVVSESAESVRAEVGAGLLFGMILVGFSVEDTGKDDGRADE